MATVANGRVNHSAGQGLNQVTDFVNIFLEHCMKDSEDQLIFFVFFQFYQMVNEKVLGKTFWH